MSMLQLENKTFKLRKARFFQVKHIKETNSTKKLTTQLKVKFDKIIYSSINSGTNPQNALVI